MSSSGLSQIAWSRACSGEKPSVAIAQSLGTGTAPVATGKYNETPTRPPTRLTPEREAQSMHHAALAPLPCSRRRFLGAAAAGLTGLLAPGARADVLILCRPIIA